MSSTVELTPRELLPELTNGPDPCHERLREEVDRLNWCERAHLVNLESAEVRLCVHYDGTAASSDEVLSAVQDAGRALAGRYGHLAIDVDPGAERVGALREAHGISEVVNRDGTLYVEYDRREIDETQIRAIVQPAVETGHGSDQGHGPDDGHDDGHGHGHDKGKGGGHDHSHGGIFGERTELIFALLSGATLGIGSLISNYTTWPGGIAFGLWLAAYFFGGFYTLREAIEKISKRQFEIDFLMLVAAVGAAILGEWPEGALLLFLFSLGHSLEGYALGRARRAIEALAELTPKTARVLRGDRQVEVPVEELQVGDTVVVRPNERMPADGFVVAGTSSVDQSAVTGESVPVDKEPVADRAAALRAADRLEAEHRVFAGTINGTGALDVTVTRRAEDNTLARVVKLVSEAESQKSPTQRFTDRFQRWFVPAVFVLVAGLLLSPLITGENFSDAFYRAMAVLVAASPCALAISTPAAVLSAVARAGRMGVLVKGGGPLENLGTLSAIAFDKTGTLTEGKPRLTDVVATDGTDEGADRLLRTAVAVEALSDHPLARAVVRGGTERLGGDAGRAGDLSSLTGLGVRATYEGETVHIGKLGMFADVEGPGVPADLAERVRGLEADGRTTMVVRSGDRYLGILGMMDTPRAEAADTIVKLRSAGIKRMIMISGDNARVAEAVGRQVGVDESWGDLMPEDKVDAIDRLNSEGRVAMVGDGVNDAPAMAKSTVGIAMGAAGSDVALETADVALMSDDLRKLPVARDLSRAASRNIKQNLYISLGVVAVLIPATVFGWFGIGAAVAVHEGSTIIVVLNALRLLRFRDRYSA